jgi:hypothetical protein
MVSMVNGCIGGVVVFQGGRNPGTPVLGQETDSYPVQMESTFSNIYVLSLGREPTGDFE